MNRVQAGQVRARVSTNRASGTRACLRRRVGNLVVDSLTEPSLEGMQQAEPVPDLVDGSMALVGRCRLIAAQPGHRVAVHPAPVLVEVLGTFIDNGRGIAVSANAIVEIREEVDIERVVAPSSRLRPKRQVRVEVDDLDAVICIEALAGNLIDDARNVDKCQIETILKECGA